MERLCSGCGKPVQDQQRRKCSSCRAVDRVCGCGKTFRGTGLRCSSCLITDRICSCGNAFRGTRSLCWTCRSTKRVCGCGATYQGTNLRCQACLRKERLCDACGASFEGARRLCPPCRAKETTCPCGATFRGQSLRCTACFRAALPPEALAARSRATNNARRARKAGAAVAGFVPSKVYRQIRSSGPCVYCQADAETVDHITPLSRGGREHVDNLVPACEWCNKSKGAKLLTEWRADRVAGAVRASVKVASAYRQLLGALPKPGGAS